MAKCTAREFALHDPGEFDVIGEFIKHTRARVSATRAREVTLRAMVVHPALLAEMVSQVFAAIEDKLEWAEAILSVLTSVTLKFNIIEGRTTDIFDLAQNALVRLEDPDRLFVLEEFAQMLALRGVDKLAPDVLSSRLEILLDAKTSDLMREFRAQTLL